MYSWEKTYSIKQLEDFCGIKAHTIRMWEKRYNILTPGRSDTNIRTYSEDELKRLIAISILNRHGTKISHIAKMNDEEILHAIMKKNSDEEEADALFSSGPLIMAALRFDETHLRNLLHSHLSTRGLEDAYLKIFYPLMQKAKSLWLTDGLSKAQEQFIDYIIRTIITTDDNLSDTNPSKETIVVASVSEYNPYSLMLFTKYLLRKRGFEVIYTGGELSAGEIAAIQAIKPFSVLVLNTGTAISVSEIKDLASLLIKKLKLRKVIIAGHENIATPITDARISYAGNPSEIVTLINSL